MVYYYNREDPFSYIKREKEVRRKRYHRHLFRKLERRGAQEGGRERGEGEEGRGKGEKTGVKRLVQSNPIKQAF